MKRVTIDYRQVRYWQSPVKGSKLRALGFIERLVAKARRRLWKNSF